MEKMTASDGISADVVSENISALKAIFPEAFSEGKDGAAAVNFDVLRQLLGDAKVLTEGEEKFGLNWHGKKQSRQIALTPSLGTLLPCPEDSVDWDNTQNLFIEGDNLEVLKLLQKSYAGQIKLIYIDPPYNTGKEFVYPDNYHDNLDTYLRYTGQKGEDGLKLTSNTDSSGRKHTNWLNMMYPRLKLARNLLTNDGSIFISINENEFSNLKFLCDEIFGEENLLSIFSWRTDGNFDNQAKFKYLHEYILLYAKSESNYPHPLVVDPSTPKDSKIFRPEIRNTIVKNGPKNPKSVITLPVGFPCNFEFGSIEKQQIRWPHYLDDAKIVAGKLSSPVRIYSGWSSKELVEEFINNSCNPIVDGKKQETSFEIVASGAVEAVKIRGEASHVISSLTNLGGPQRATSEVLSTGAVFDDYPKPLALLKYLSKMPSGNDFLALDFFAGSGTLAHAIAELNIEDGGTRRTISVQLPEPTTKTDENGNSILTGSAKAGFKTISEVTRARLKGLKKLYPLFSGDIGYKAFKLASSNIRVWNPDAKDLEASLLAHVDHLIEGRSEQDVLYELLLKRGIDLCAPIEARTVGNKVIHSIGFGVLFACLSEAITREAVEEVANAVIDWHKELKPETDSTVVFRDSAFADDVAKSNMAAILNQYGIKHVRSL